MVFWFIYRTNWYIGQSLSRLQSYLLDFFIKYKIQYAESRPDMKTPDNNIPAVNNLTTEIELNNTGRFIIAKN